MQPTSSRTAAAQRRQDQQLDPPATQRIRMTTSSGQVASSMKMDEL